MTLTLVGIPVLGRPENAAKVAASLYAASPDARLLFIATPGDDAELAAIDATGEDCLVVTWPAGPGDFARKHNAGFALACEEGYDWYYCGADDLHFHPGWLEAAVRTARKTNACVVGTNDLHNANVVRGWYATHFLVHRDYVDCGTIDEAGKLLHEGYDHQSVDIEFCQTAKFRRTYAHAFDSRVEHEHPHWGLAEMDPTYDKALRATHADIALFESRKHLWNGGRPR